MVQIIKTPTLEIPEDLFWALDANAQARAVFDKFSYSHRKEVIRWIESARQRVTRAERLQQALDMMLMAETRDRAV